MNLLPSVLSVFSVAPFLLLGLMKLEMGKRRAERSKSRAKRGTKPLATHLPPSGFRLPLSTFLFPLSAFTLLEMLVVIAILAILASLLLPAAGRMIEKGNQVVCAGNLRQLSAAYLLYAGDHNGELLRPRIDETSGGVTTTSLWSTILNDGHYIEVPYKMIIQGINCKGVLYCPSEKVHHGKGDYGPNTVNNRTPPANRRLSSVTEPAKKVMICESRVANSFPPTTVPWCGDWSTWPAGAKGWINQLPDWPFRHGNGTLIYMAFFDGHTEARTRISLAPAAARKEIFDNVYQEGW